MANCSSREQQITNQTYETASNTTPRILAAALFKRLKTAARNEPGRPVATYRGSSSRRIPAKTHVRVY
jgi:hypothetical protein